MRRRVVVVARAADAWGTEQLMEQPMEVSESQA